MVDLNKVNTMKHISGTIEPDYGYETTEENIANTGLDGGPIQLKHGDLDIVTINGETKHIGKDEELGEIVPLTSVASAAVRKAFRDGTFNLFVEKGSKVEFGGKHLPTGTVTGNSHLITEKGASVQHIDMDNSDLHWTKGVIKATTIDDSSNGKDDLQTGGGYLTNSVIKNGSEIGMDNNHLSKTTLDNVVAGNISAENCDLKTSKKTKVSKHKATFLGDNKFKNVIGNLGADSNVVDSQLTNLKLDSDLSNSIDNTELQDANLSNANADAKATTGYTFSGSKISEVIATTPFTASDSQIAGKPWHPFLIDSKADISNSTLETNKGVAVAVKGDKPLVLNGANLDDDAIRHGVAGLKVNENTPGFKALGKMDKGRYGKGPNQEIDEKQVKSVVKEVQASKQPTTYARPAQKPKAKAKADEPELG